MTSRRDFLAASTSAAAVSAVPPTLASVGPYDFAAIDARLARRARHRQVFGVSRVDDGVAIAQMRHALDAYERTMGEGAGSLHPAAVFYARGVVQGLGDRMWREYRLDEHVRRRGDALGDSHSHANPFTSELALLQTRGASFFVCDNALADWATYLVSVGGFTQMSLDDLHVRLRGNLVAGALLVPAGVALLNMAQETRFTYVNVSA